MKKIGGLLAAIAVLTVGAAPWARADFVSNIGTGAVPQTRIGDGTGGIGVVGQQFTTGTNGGDLANLVFRLSENGTAVNDLAVSLYAADGTVAANGTLPGTLLGTFSGPQPDGATPGNYAFTPTSLITLAAATSYWAVLTATYIDVGAGNGFTAVATADPSETGSAG